jgi:hypothetical protein
MSGNSPLLHDDETQAGTETDRGTSLLNRERLNEAMGDSNEYTANGPSCSNCGHGFATQEVTVCDRCGYYASLGTFVEVDPWEETQAAEAATDVVAASHVEVWVRLLGTFYKRIPSWAWILAFCVLIVFVESLIARAFTPDPKVSPLRMHWSLTQLAIGASVFIVCHLYIYVKAAMRDDKYGLIDVVLSPAALWLDCFSRLPKTQIPVITAGTSAVAYILSIVLIGAIPYERLLDWGIEAPPEQNLLAAITAQAQKAKAKDQSLEEAVGDFAGKVEVEEGPVVTKETRNIQLECIVVGFRVEEKNPKKITSLLLAAEMGRRLVVVGAVGFDVAPSIEEDLTRKIFAAERTRPFVHTTKNARWVAPKFVCKISCVKRLKNGHVIDPVLDKISAELDLGL